MPAKFLYVLCHPETGRVLDCKIESEKTEDPISLSIEFSEWKREERNCFRVIELNDVEIESLSNIEALLSMKDSNSVLGQTVTQIFSDLLTAGMRLQQATAISRR